MSAKTVLMSTIGSTTNSAVHHRINFGDATVLLMRTTITLTPEVAALVQRAMDERGQSFKDVVNAAIESALAPELSQERYVTPVFDLGRAYFDITKVNQFLADEDDRRLLKIMNGDQ